MRFLSENFRCDSADRKKLNISTSKSTIFAEFNVEMGISYPGFRVQFNTKRIKIDFQIVETYAFSFLPKSIWKRFVTKPTKYDRFYPKGSCFEDKDHFQLQMNIYIPGVEIPVKTDFVCPKENNSRDQKAVLGYTFLADNAYLLKDYLNHDFYMAVTSDNSKAFQTTQRALGQATS